jgi:hypothetical protein
MEEKYWDKPVLVEIERTGKSRIIRSTHGAAVFLLYRWPGKGGPQHNAAREACIAVLAGEKPPEHARQAFIEAAKEAGILMEHDW